MFLSHGIDPYNLGFPHFLSKKPYVTLDVYLNISRVMTLQ